MNRFILNDIAKKSQEAKKYVKSANDFNMNMKWKDSYKNVSYNMKMAERLHKDSTDGSKIKGSSSKGVAINPMINMSTYTALKGLGLSKMLKGQDNKVDNNSGTYVGVRNHSDNLRPISFNSLLDNSKHKAFDTKNQVSANHADGSDLVPLYDNRNGTDHHDSQLSNNLLVIGGIALCMMLL